MTVWPIGRSKPHHRPPPPTPLGRRQKQQNTFDQVRVPREGETLRITPDKDKLNSETWWTAAKQDRFKLVCKEGVVQWVDNSQRGISVCLKLSSDQSKHWLPIRALVGFESWGAARIGAQPPRDEWDDDADDSWGTWPAHQPNQPPRDQPQPPCRIGDGIPPKAAPPPPLVPLIDQDGNMLAPKCSGYYCNRPALEKGGRCCS